MAVGTNLFLLSHMCIFCEAAKVGKNVNWIVYFVSINFFRLFLFVLHILEFFVIVITDVLFPPLYIGLNVQFVG